MVSPGHPVSRLTNNCFLLCSRGVASRVDHKKLQNFSSIIRLHCFERRIFRKICVEMIKVMDRKENFKTLFTQMFEKEDDNEGHKMFSTGSLLYSAGLLLILKEKNEGICQSLSFRGKYRMSTCHVK